MHTRFHSECAQGRYRKPWEPTVPTGRTGRCREVCPLVHVHHPTPNRPRRTFQQLLKYAHVS